MKYRIHNFELKKSKNQSLESRKSKLTNRIGEHLFTLKAKNL